MGTNNNGPTKHERFLQRHAQRMAEDGYSVTAPAKPEAIDLAILSPFRDAVNHGKGKELKAELGMPLTVICNIANTGKATAAQLQVITDFVRRRADTDIEGDRAAAAVSAALA